MSEPVGVTVLKAFAYKGRMCLPETRVTMSDLEATAYERRGFVTLDTPQPSVPAPPPAIAVAPEPPPPPPPPAPEPSAPQVEESPVPEQAHEFAPEPSIAPQQDVEQELSAAPAEPMTTESLRRTRRRTERA